MKTYPIKWNTAQLAFFVGLLSGRMGIGALRKIVSELQLPSDSPSVYFSLLIERIEPMIPADQWAGVVKNCERLFK
jgi:uncharacterized membrane protein YagU involved in acid resistance